MKQALAALGLLCLLASAAYVLWARTPTGGPIYSVAQVVAGLRRHPRAWIGRTIRVEGDAILIATSSPAGGTGGVTVTSCLTRRCAMTYPAVPVGARVHVIIVDNGSPLSPTTPYLLQRQASFNAPPPLDPSVVPHLLLRVPSPPSSGLLATLRHLPFVGRFLPDPATVPGHTERVYRVHILPRGAVACTLGTWCDDATMLGSP